MDISQDSAWTQASYSTVLHWNRQVFNHKTHSFIASFIEYLHKKKCHRRVWVWFYSAVVFVSVSFNPPQPTSCVHVLLYVVRIHCLQKFEWFGKSREFSLVMIGTHWAQTLSQGLCPRAPLVTARSVIGQFVLFSTKYLALQLPPFLCASESIGAPTEWSGTRESLKPPPP